MAENVQDRLPRLLALVPWLSHRPGITLTETAGHFGISVDQLTTDLYQLVVCGVPGYGPDQLVDIDFYDGEHIWVTDPQTLSAPMRLTADELTAHLMALRFLSQLPGLADREEIGMLAAKLDQATGLSGNESTEDIFHVMSNVEPDVQNQVAESLSQGVKMQFEYLAGDESVTQRVVSPIRVFRVDDNLYLEAVCDQAEAIRLFRLDRIRGTHLLMDQISHLSDFETGRPAGATDSNALEAIKRAPQATIRLSESARWLAEEYWIDVDPDDPMVIKVPFLSEDWLIRWVLGLGGSVQLIEPQEIAERLVSTIREGLDRLQAQA